MNKEKFSSIIPGYAGKVSEIKYLDNLSVAVELNVIAGAFFGTIKILAISHGFCSVDGQ